MGVDSRPARGGEADPDALQVVAHPVPEGAADQAHADDVCGRKRALCWQRAGHRVEQSSG
jgi:hypothetical protein